jgi:putative ABC transport system permease protein
LIAENIKIALKAIRNNLLRSVLTILIIAIGITALVGILTAIDSIKQSINSNFTSLGANTFTIRNRELVVRIGRGGRKPKKYAEITYTQAMRFKELYTFPCGDHRKRNQRKAISKTKKHHQRGCKYWRWQI